MCASQVSSGSVPPSVVISFVREDKSIPFGDLEMNSNESTSSPTDSSYLEKVSSVKLQGDLIQMKVSHAVRAQEFADHIKTAKENSSHGAYVHAYSAEEYEEMNLCIAYGGLAGCAIKEGGDIVSVFKNDDCKIRGVLDHTMPEAIKMGGNNLDCFAPALPLMYAKYGFVPIAKLKFVDEYAPDGWNFSRDGRPDIIFLVLDREKMKVDSTTGFSTISIESRKEMVSKAIEDLMYEENYDDAIKKVKEKISVQ